MSSRPRRISPPPAAANSPHAADLNKSLVDLWLATGTLLRRLRHLPRGGASLAGSASVKPWENEPAPSSCLAAAGRRSAAAEVDGLTLPWKAVRVSSPVQEIVAEIKVREGDVVKKDQVLARLHDEREQAEYERATKIVEKREFDAKAATALVADKITSREKALEAEIELKLANVDVDHRPPQN